MLETVEYVVLEVIDALAVVMVAPVLACLGLLDADSCLEVEEVHAGLGLDHKGLPIGGEARVPDEIHGVTTLNEGLKLLVLIERHLPHKLEVGGAGIIDLNYEHGCLFCILLLFLAVLI